MNDNLLKNHNIGAVNVAQIGKYSWCRYEKQNLDTQNTNVNCALEHNCHTTSGEVGEWAES